MMKNELQAGTTVQQSINTEVPTSTPTCCNILVSGIPQRPIKFRAWNCIVNRMQYFKLEDIEKQKGNIQWHILTIMQFTGMLDKLGNEIYEGDIVQTVANDGARLSKFKIYYDDCKFIKLREDGNNYPLESNQSCLQIIGNVFEKPELLG